MVDLAQTVIEFALYPELIGHFVVMCQSEFGFPLRPTDFSIRQEPANARETFE
jgi:hypothetical protein